MTITVAVDNAPGFQSLINNNDQDLKDLDIKLIKTDKLNKNGNAVVDKGCQELEDELKRQEPEGTKISLCILKRALLNLNSKLRRRGNISAYEIHSARDQLTGENLSLNDKQIRNDQLAKREDKRDLPTEEINIGDTVKLRNNNDKHKSSEIYVVTNKDKENVTVQKLLHPLKNTPTMIMSKTYKTKSKLLKKIHQARQPEYADVIEDDQT